MESEMKVAAQSEDNTVIEAMRSETIMVSSMSHIHLDAANKDYTKDGTSGEGDRRPLPQKSEDETRLKEAEVRDRLEERNSNARKLQRQAAKRASEDPHRPPRVQRPASNGYRGRLSIWAPEGFNPLLDLSHLMDECGPVQDAA